MYRACLVESIPINSLPLRYVFSLLLALKVPNTNKLIDIFNNHMTKFYLYVSNKSPNLHQQPLSYVQNSIFGLKKLNCLIKNT